MQEKEKDEDEENDKDNPHEDQGHVSRTSPALQRPSLRPIVSDQPLKALKCAFSSPPKIEAPLIHIEVHVFPNDTIL